MISNQALQGWPIFSPVYSSSTWCVKYCRDEQSLYNLCHHFYSVGTHGYFWIHLSNQGVAFQNIIENPSETQAMVQKKSINKLWTRQPWCLLNWIHPPHHHRCSWLFKSGATMQHRCHRPSYASVQFSPSRDNLSLKRIQYIDWGYFWGDKISTTPYSVNMEW